MAAVLLVGMALAACGHQGPSSQPTATASATAAGLSPSPADSVATDSATPAASDTPAATDTPAPTTGPTAPDAVASELDQINQLINDINNSIQSSSSGGGE
jgi:predicted small lipoprotein YifL